MTALGGLESILSGGTAQNIGEQLLLWAVLGQIVGAVMGPITGDVEQQIYKVLNTVPLSPADAADAVLKGWKSQTDGANEAVLSGVNAERFATLVDITGEPPGIEQMMEAARRNIIPWSSGPDAVSVETAIRQSRIRDEWTPVLQALQWLPLPVADAVNAVVRGQIPFADGAAIAKVNGIQEPDFQVLVNTTGRPPAPQELITLFRRGLIPLSGTGPDALTVQQGIYEGDLKDKWWSLLSQLSEYLPPPRTITALTRSGAISSAEAATLYQQQGLSADLAAAYARSASAAKVTKAKSLAETQVVQMYEDRILNRGEATSLLSAIGYDSTEVTFILELADMRSALAALNAAIKRVGTLYVARKIGPQTARNDLGVLGLDAAHIDALMQSWNVERSETSRLLTETQITDAVSYSVMTADQGQSALEALGYTPFDAWVLLSVKNKAALPNPPPFGATLTGQEP